MGFLGLFGWGKRATKALQLVGTSEKLKRFLSNQIDQINSLKKNGQLVFINEVSVAYMLHLIMMIDRNPVQIDDSHLVIQTAFRDTDLTPWIDNAFQIIQGDVEFEVKLAALYPIAKKEFEAGSGDFLVRYILKVAKDQAIPRDPGRDLSKESKWSTSNLP